MKQLIFILLLPILTFAQNQGNFWYFGDKAGVDFNSGSPITVTDGAIAFDNNLDPFGNPYSYSEGSTAISDVSGNLLFYSDGQLVWNRAHQVLPNGDSLLGSFSSSQSSIIVPDPGNPDRYFYLFTVGSLMGAVVNADPTNGFRYSKIDLCLDNSYGDILPNYKNIKLADTVAEKVAVTRHSNGIDYWILIHKYYSDEFWSYKLTSNGIEDTVVTAIGSSHNGSQYAVQGQMKFSPNGQKIAIGATNGLDLLELFDFNNSTGVVSNFMPLETPVNNQCRVYGVEFSPDNSKLYATASSYVGNSFTCLAQYDLLAGGGSLAAINASLFEVFLNTSGLMTPQGLQIGPDNKIYSISMLDQTFLSVINAPNLLGSNCNFQFNAISLLGREASQTLPTFISNFDYSNNVNNCGELGLFENSSDQPTLIKIIDQLGRKTKFEPNTTLIYIYSDGTTEKVYRME